ncbi:outer membrane protein assembly factor BamC [Psychromonas sp. MME2]|uniref:outer membrane protein assembly factor BamC n=1 Tax=unclassified Psychromonas TaxID=2614957 RepID=UPI00339C73F7
MIKLFKQSKLSTSILIAIALSGCSSFDSRMQANGPYQYTDEKPAAVYNIGDFSHDEETALYKTPALTEMQIQNGFMTKDVDIRPPTQLISPMEGVLLDPTATKYTKIWFNRMEQGESIEDVIWHLLEDYLQLRDINITSKNDYLKQLETTTFIEDKVDIGNYLITNEMIRKSSYFFSLEKLEGINSVALNVQLLTFVETNNGKELPYNYSDQSRRNIELGFVNSLLDYAYQQQKNAALEALDSQPLPIKLGFDDNYQIAWIVDTNFTTTWLKLPSLFKLLSFELVESDENLGYFLLKFNRPNDEYWQANNLNPFELKEAEYFVQLGESIGGNTSIVWLDEDKKPLPDQTVTDLYFSITEKVRDVLLLKNQQTKPL